MDYICSGCAVLLLTLLCRLVVYCIGHIAVHVYGLSIGLSAYDLTSSSQFRCHADCMLFRLCLFIVCWLCVCVVLCTPETDTPTHRNDPSVWDGALMWYFGIFSVTPVSFAALSSSLGPTLVR